MTVDRNKGLNDQNPKKPGDIKFKKAADKITVNKMSKDEAAALDADAAICQRYFDLRCLMQILIVDGKRLNERSQIE